MPQLCAEEENNWPGASTVNSEITYQFASNRLTGIQKKNYINFKKSSVHSLSNNSENKP